MLAQPTVRYKKKHEKWILKTIKFRRTKNLLNVLTLKKEPKQIKRVISSDQKGKLTIYLSKQSRDPRKVKIQNKKIKASVFFQYLLKTSRRKMDIGSDYVRDIYSIFEITTKCCAFLLLFLVIMMRLLQLKDRNRLHQQGRKQGD